MRAPGYTLVELVVTTAILAVLAVAARPLVSPVKEASLDAAAREVTNALRFARSEAMRTGGMRGVDFSVDPGTGVRRIRVFRTDAATPPNAVYDVYHPLAKNLYVVQFDATSVTQGVTITTAAFLYKALPSTSISRDQVAFDATGMPEYYPDTANYTLAINVASPAQVVVTYAGKTRSVKLDAVTGRVTVQ